MVAIQHMMLLILKCKYKLNKHVLFIGKTEETSRKINCGNKC